ncbi:hypothetical protein D2E27_16720 [Mycobacteroides abscessus]|nr:hypothetical protein DDJ37_24800 [Mycobacteroides abscessus]PVB18533.1 hypothetical protein DDJ40_01345 [Mycobacteroides abscessus]RIR11228.1 hypothetical protein D2E27_16720 [Mycobacteroides abscessus]
MPLGTRSPTYALGNRSRGGRAMRWLYYQPPTGEVYQSREGGTGAGPALDGFGPSDGPVSASSCGVWSATGIPGPTRMVQPLDSITR